MQIRFEMPREAYDRLVQLREAVGAGSLAEVIGDALKLYDGVVREGGPRPRLVVERPDGTTALVRVFK